MNLLCEQLGDFLAQRKIVQNRHVKMTAPAPRSLLSRPQRLGVLPTWWFWNDGVNIGLLRPISAPINWLVGASSFLLTVYLDWPTWSAFVILALYNLALLGLTERYIRRRALAARPGRAQAVSHLLESITPGEDPG